MICLGEELMRTHRFVGAVVVLGAAFALASAGLAIAQEGVTRTVILKKPLEGDPKRR